MIVKDLFKNVLPKVTFIRKKYFPNLVFSIISIVVYDGKFNLHTITRVTAEFSLLTSFLQAAYPKG